MKPSNVEVLDPRERRQDERRQDERRQVPLLQRVPAPAGTTWHRAWPGGRPGEQDRPLVLEGRDADGHVVAATARPHLRSGVLTGAHVQVLREDHRLPALGTARAEGAVLVGHRAGKRAVLRSGAAGAPQSFLKVARPAATRTALARLHAVDAALGGHPGRPALVEVTGAAEGLLRLRPAMGCDLSALLAAGEDPAALARCHAAGRATAVAGGALAAVTASPAAAGLPVHDAGAEAAVLRRWAGDARDFGVLASAQAARLNALVTAVGDALLALPPVPPVLSHRDLHEAQVLVRFPQPGCSDGVGALADPGAAVVTFLDVDTAARADPCLDAANLLAHLDLALVRGAAPAAVAAVRAGLREGWAACGHPLLDSGPQRLALWRTAARLRLVAVHAFRGSVSDLAHWIGCHALR
ncbi:hypothetical protein [Kineococcus sp. SYSU DK006]|uniref:hypothetical protein n=1 Tax=Kineococcus sp. SYSU DK006 TaxID=3383127 RepID=UPI003D7D0358